MATEPAKHDAAELKDEIQTKTLHLILLTIVTSGLYPLLWLTRHHDTFNRITKKQTINMKLLSGWRSLPASAWHSEMHVIRALF
ncbi:DUF4234 domain-containing protein [Undibacterium rugosum]|uniref:DUF4234 domain-containing protein n=1 Tax=Undibacterium rugosum TaxID=2762291 RepID=UPI0039B08D58